LAYGNGEPSRNPQVGVDNQQVGWLAATYLLERGLRHFGFVGPPRYGFALQREARFRQVIEAAGHALRRFDEMELLP
jgi:DNA-binding LacI/PurR family transcriptional regulator